MNYVGTFISGFEKKVAKLLEEKIEDVKIINIYNGLILFNTNQIERISSLLFFNNIYLLLNKSNIKYDDFDKNIKSIIDISIDYKKIKSNFISKNTKTFKIKAFKENQPTRFDYRIVTKLENEIKNKLNLKLSNNPNIEFVIQMRSEGILLFMMKLTNNRVTEKDLKKGTLRPEMCYLLISLANLNKNDIVLDPFFGSGAIPKTIVKHFNYNMCFATELEESFVSNLKKEYKNNNKKLFIKQKDCRNLDCFNDNFIDAIITDPPWNVYNKDNSMDFYEFYKEMLVEFTRILKDNGRMIILMGNQDLFEKSLNSIEKLELKNKISVLVNGKKANVYCIEKSTESKKYE